MLDRTVAIFLLTAFCFGQHSRPAKHVLTNWPEFHRRNMQRYNPYERFIGVDNAANLKLKWIASGLNASDPVAADGVVYVGAYVSPSDHGIFALDAHTGNMRWSFQTSGDVYGAPAVANGVVYVGTDNDAVYALDASNGTQLWSYPAYVTSSLALANGILYIPANFHGYTLDASTGALLWDYHIRDEYVLGSPAVANGLAYFCSHDPGKIYALDVRNGHPRWLFNTGIDDLFASPAVADGVIYIAAGTLYALSARTSVRLWSDSINTESPPAVANGVVYVGSYDQNVYALDAHTGVKLWAYKTGGSVGSSPAVANGVLYIASNDGNIYALNASTGAKLWSYYSGAGFSDPIVVNGTVYVSASNGVYAFGLE